MSGWLRHKKDKKQEHGKRSLRIVDILQSDEKRVIDCKIKHNNCITKH